MKQIVWFRLTTFFTLQSIFGAEDKIKVHRMQHNNNKKTCLSSSMLSMCLSGGRQTPDQLVDS